MQYAHDYTVFMGRFEPTTLAHLRVAMDALQNSHKLIIAVGSADSGRRTVNPFTYEERVDIWKHILNEHLPSEDLDRVSFIPLEDNFYSDAEWTSHVRYRVNNHIRTKFMLEPTECNIALTGCDKDRSSYYLAFFPEWEYNLVDKVGEYSATKVREIMYRYALLNDEDQTDAAEGYIQNIVVNGGFPSAYEGALGFWEIIDDLAFEWDFDKNYEPRNFNQVVTTVDSVPVMNGHVLVVRRKHQPGKGLLAMPGGHLNEGERLQAAMLRELREETSIDINDSFLRANIVGEGRVFDHPDRSQRARVITTAYLIKLPDGEKFPDTKAADDAVEALWIPIGEVKPADFFEDHAHVIKKMTAGL